MTDYHQREGCTDYRREVRTKQNIYECPPPPPVELSCSVCHTAERNGRNIWSCVPFMSYSTVCGPSLGDILVHVLNLLPLSVISWLGVGHKKTCPTTTSSKSKPPVVCYEPINKKSKKNNQSYGGEQVVAGYYAAGDSSSDNLSAWMHDEYVSLARELADLRRLTCEGEEEPDNRDLLQARNYVLDRLAEMLAKREEIEKRMKKKKHRGLC